MTTGQISEEALQYFEDKRIKALLEEAMHNLLLNLPDDPLAFLQKSFSTPTPLRIILAGGPGSGRGTQSRLLAEKYNLLAINARELLIREFEEGSEVGHRIESYLRKAAIVPDEIYVELIMREVHKAEENYKGWVLDGFPQTRAHAIYLQNAGISPQKFFYLSIPEEVAAKRCLGRRVKSTKAEKNSLISALSLDDSPEGVSARLKHFLARKDELLDCYQPFFVRVPGAGSIEEVNKEICEQIDNLDIAI
eukprot:gene7097-5031_t